MSAVTDSRWERCKISTAYGFEAVRIGPTPHFISLTDADCIDIDRGSQNVTIPALGYNKYIQIL
jgi:hypothetical protein